MIVKLLQKIHHEFIECYINCKSINHREDDNIKNIFKKRYYFFSELGEQEPRDFSKDPKMLL